MCGRKVLGPIKYIVKINCWLWLLIRTKHGASNDNLWEQIVIVQTAEDGFDYK